MLERLRTFKADRADFDELVELSALGRILRAEYEGLGGEVPDWVDVALKSVRREAHSRQADAIEARLAKAKLRRAGLATTEEKRAAIDKEIEALENRAKGGGA
jgi:hypothetical protein